MIIHKKCNSIVRAYAPAIVISGGINFNRRGIKLSGIKTESSKREIANPKFACSCTEDIPVEELVGICDYCGKEFELSELYKVENIAGIYCQNCREDFDIKGKGSQVSKLIYRLNLNAEE